MPAKLRTAAAVPLAGASLLLLTSCFLTPTPAPNATPTPTATTSGNGQELIDTTWSGTDSDGDDWVFEFQEDGTVAVDLNGSANDDDRDIWTVSGTEIVISVTGGDRFGEIIHTGEYSGLEEPMELDVRTSVGESWTLTLERED
jgi:hypothetical protein